MAREGAAMAWALGAATAASLAGCGDPAAMGPLGTPVSASADAKLLDSSLPVEAGPRTAGLCFSALPAHVTSTGEAPMPRVALSCPGLQAPPWFSPGASPAPTLPLQLGYRDMQGLWHPYQDGDWVPLGTLQQGGFHLDLVPQVQLAGQSAAKLQLQAEAFAHSGCQIAAALNLSKLWLAQAPGGDSLYTTETASKTLLIFGDSASQIKKSCGIWLQVVWRVRLAGTAQWGQVVRTLRTYDSSGLAQGIPPPP